MIGLGAIVQQFDADIDVPLVPTNINLEEID